jgi:hypothetical protein
LSDTAGLKLMKYFPNRFFDLPGRKGRVGRRNCTASLS